jgi:hypothetical protein
MPNKKIPITDMELHPMQLMGTGMGGGGAFIPSIHENDAIITVVIIKINPLLEITHVTVIIKEIVEGDRKFENGF